ncbi:hypothetical protein M758_10G169500 [Ceratodon purpureus]|nr:hypothetical protein M758_10G169500 [Ceratodon purpureus]
MIVLGALFFGQTLCLRSVVVRSELGQDLSQRTHHCCRSHLLWSFWLPVANLGVQGLW